MRGHNRSADPNDQQSEDKRAGDDQFGFVKHSILLVLLAEHFSSMGNPIESTRETTIRFIRSDFTSFIFHVHSR